VARINLQDFDGAREDVERALQEEQDNLLAVLLRAELYSLEERYDLALEWCERARRLRPEVSWTHTDLGAIYLQQGNLEQALAALDRAIELNPRFYLSYVLRSIVRFQAEDLAGARADQEKAVSLGPKEALVFPEYFLTTLKGLLDWSLEYYAWVVRRMPNSPHPFHGRGDALRANGIWEDAIRDYSQAIRLTPRQAELYLSRGKAHLEAGDLMRAAEDFRLVDQLHGKTHLRRKAGELLKALEPELSAVRANAGGRVKLTERSIDL
jgi:tetratricopeptide (TPR) repeat protein